MRKLTTEDFIARAKEVHGDKYDYSRVEYAGANNKVCVVCPVHGEFWPVASQHMLGGQCPKCQKDKTKLSLASFIEQAKAQYGNKYDYSKVELKGNKAKVCIIYPEHGEWWTTPNNFLRGNSCPGCFGTPKKTKEEFIRQAQEVHNNKYVYSLVEYNSTNEKVCIICPEHGEFWQTPNNHLFGAGCPACPQSQMEGEIRQFLIKNNIVFEPEKTFDWLIYNRNMYLDFFLPDYGVAIECQGGQHFFPTELFGGEEFYQLTIDRDKKKRELCEAHGITVLYYSKSHIDYPYPVFESLNLLLATIRRRGLITDTSQWKDPELPLIFD